MLQLFKARSHNNRLSFLLPREEKQAPNNTKEPLLQASNTKKGQKKNIKTKCSNKQAIPQTPHATIQTRYNLASIL